MIHIPSRECIISFLCLSIFLFYFPSKIGEPQIVSNISLNGVNEGESFGLSCSMTYYSAVDWFPEVQLVDARNQNLTTIDQSSKEEARILYASVADRYDSGNSFQCRIAFRSIPEERLGNLRDDHDLRDPEFSFISTPLRISVICEYTIPRNTSGLTLRALGQCPGAHHQRGPTKLPKTMLINKNLNKKGTTSVR